MGTDANSVRLRQEALRAFAINNGLLMGPPDNATLNVHAMDQLISLSLSSRDLASIKFIQDMGFDRERVIESYIAHDRSENDTIDALLKNDEDV
uniref:UBA domain-containing protein n=1 Tax=Rhabditophanes sp. KR3021 TaxID=114890 RepID=A0AC35TL09_9BILA